MPRPESGAGACGPWQGRPDAVSSIRQTGDSALAMRDALILAWKIPRGILGAVHASFCRCDTKGLIAQKRKLLTASSASAFDQSEVDGFAEAKIYILHVTFASVR